MLIEFGKRIKYNSNFQLTEVETFPDFTMIDFKMITYKLASTVLVMISDYYFSEKFRFEDLGKFQITNFHKPL